MQKRDSLFRSVILLLLIGVNPLFGQAQGDDLKPVTSKYAIKNATIIQAPGKVITNGSLVIENGVIKAVGSNITIPADAWLVDADSMFVYAGFISGLSNIGVVKPEEKERNDDRKLTGTPTYERAGITPGNSARSTLSAKEKSVKDFRQLGFTASHSVPHKGMLPGKGSFILLGGDNGESMVIKDEVSMFSQFSGAGGVYPNTVIGVMAKYRDLYRKASQARDYSKRYSANPNGMERPDPDATIEALIPVVSKQMPVVFKTEDLLSIMRAKTLKDELGFDIVFGEVKQGWDAISAIKSTGGPVFLSLDLPELKEEESKESDEEKEMSDEEKEEMALKTRQQEMIKNHYTQAGQFNRNGIKFGFSTMEVKAKDFKTNLLKVIENGLSADEALAALTTEPASILGVSNMMGTIETGKMANLIVTDTVYFTKDANVKYVFVDGVKYEYEGEKKQKKKSSNEEAIDPVGKWNYTAETPDGDVIGIIDIKGSEGDYSGTITVSLNQSTNDLLDIDVDGNKLSFSFNIDVGQEINVGFNLEVDGDSISGEAITPDGSAPVEGSREPEN